MKPTLRIQKFTGQVRYRGKAPKRAYYFRIVAANGEKIAQSEAYASARARNNTAKLIASAAFYVA